jgi:hypothetical protein
VEQALNRVVVTDGPVRERPQAYWLAVTILILIILSSISFCAETVEAVREDAFTIGYAPILSIPSSAAD